MGVEDVRVDAKEDKDEGDNKYNGKDDREGGEDGRRNGRNKPCWCPSWRRMGRG